MCLQTNFYEGGESRWVGGEEMDVAFSQDCTQAIEVCVAVEG